MTTAFNQQPKHTNVASVILAGGRATRMENQDKGLVLYKGQALVSYAIAALSPIVSQLYVNANRNLTHYQRFGYPVITDPTDSYDGPLSGVLAALACVTTDHLLVMPCDCPLIQTRHGLKLLQQHIATQANATVAFDGQRLHPVFFAVRTSLRESLSQFLASGQRKVGDWLTQQHRGSVDFSDEPEIFTNINSLLDLAYLEAHHAP